MDTVILLKKILKELGNPKTILSSSLRKEYVKNTKKTSGFYDFSIWLEAFDYLKVVRGTTQKKTFEPDYKRIDSYEQPS